MATIASPDEPDDYLFEQARAARQFYEANRATFGQMARLADQMRPFLEQMAPTIRAVQQMSQDMNWTAILARQHAAFTAMLPTIRVPTEAELAETQDRMAELVPETDEQREQVVQQAAEIQADPEGKKLIEQLTDWVTEIMNRLDDVAAKHRTAVGPTVRGWLCRFGLPDAEVNRMALFCVAGALWMMVFPPSGK